MPFIGSGIVVNSSFAQEQPETLENILKGVVEGISFVLSPKYKPIVLRRDFKIVGKVLCVVPGQTAAMTEIVPIKDEEQSW